MPQRFFVLSSLIILLALPGCSSSNRNQRPAGAHPPSGGADRPVPALANGEFALWVESEPSGGIVVVNGKPVGRTPQCIVLLGNARAFCREEVSIKVRFVAADTDHTSQTVEEVLTPLDRIPARVRFSPKGVSRVVR